MSSADFIDTELLIFLVENRPALWNKTCELYKDRNKTKQAWREVCVGLRKDFETLEDEEKDSFGKEVIRRWGNIRDCYVKSRKKEMESKKSGPGSSRLKKYVYSDELKFLSKVIDERAICDSSKTNTVVPEVTTPDENVEDTFRREPQTQATRAQREHCSKRKREPDEIELRMIKVLEEGNDRHLSFFKGIIPSIKDFSEEDILEFQMGVLTLIKNIKYKNAQTLHGQLLSSSTVVKEEYATDVASGNSDTCSPLRVMSNIPVVKDPLSSDSKPPVSCDTNYPRQSNHDIRVFTASPAQSSHSNYSENDFIMS
ncbi:uncharacterized protein [Periplaneta americana]|uniref:uncharacterized protein isoform X2 n=1 Tax=Periplaneta americana TaxID=6978 RepID=UPI0037E7E1C2